MKKYYSFAGVDICVNIPRDNMYEDARHFAPFLTECAEDPHTFTFVLVDTLVPPTGEPIAREGDFQVFRQEDATVRYIGTWDAPHLRAEHRGKIHTVQAAAAAYGHTIGIKTVLNAIAAEHLVVEAGGVILHCSYIEHQGRGILFTAPSETGKSTQAALWQQYRGADIINGDRAAMRFFEGKPWAMGVPFSGSSVYCKNRTLPLAAIVCLEQAPVTSIRPLQGFGAFRRVWEGCSVNTWDKTDVAMASQTLTRILEQVPVYLLACTPDETAVKALEGVL